ncbi:MAG TPA: universal stress protein [Thermodesulfovibrionales bacterium]|jgi:nucleotide-binding universal stress UspA family protein|nr:universal stress protein [Thermodesulfovibrionales bacterium]
MAQSKRILIAVDESENSRNALLYVADILGGFPGFIIILLSVISVPEVDFFDSEEARKEWIREKHASLSELLERYRQVLIQSGFPDSCVLTDIILTKDRPVSSVILEKQEQYDACTLVVGRRGVSRHEEFLFGSVSSKLIHMAARCAVWVIEPVCKSQL